MTPRLSERRTMILGAIALFGATLGVLGLFSIGDRESLWTRQAHLRIRMPSAGGIDVGARVRVQGINAGQVEALLEPEQRGGEVLVRVRLDGRFLRLLGADARAEVRSEGLIGGKTLEIIPGTPGAQPLPPDSVLPGRTDNLMEDLRQVAGKSQAVLDEMQQLSKKTRELGEKGDRLLGDLSALSLQTKSAVAEIETLTRDVREGNGPLGRELVGTLRQFQQTGLAINQSIEALKNMPVVGKYLDQSTKLLVRPNYFRHATTFKEEDLFPAGRALFTPEGLAKLNAWANAELPKAGAKGAEIVIVAYNGSAADPQAADVLTQRQAEAVRTYLIDQHKIDRLGWFTSRTVQALGMGVRPAPGEPANPANPAAPPNRIEIIIFAPPGA